MTRTRPAYGAIEIGWSGPGIFIEISSWAIQQHVWPNLGNAARSGQGHADVELLPDDIDRFGDAGLARGAETVNISTAQHAGARPERQRPQHILPGPDAAVEHHLDVGADRIDDLRQHGDGGRGAIKLASAMVGDYQGRGAAPGRQPRVFHVEHAFEDQLAGPDAADPLNIVPVQRGIELAG